MSVELLFLGTGDAFGSGGRLQACIHIQTPSLRFLLDCGTTALIGMKRYGADPSLVDLILLSHLHGDHFGGIPFLILDGQFNRRTRPLMVAGPEGVEKRVREAMEIFFPGSSQVRRKFDVEFVEMKEKTPIALMDIAVVAYPAVHPSGAPSHALRVKTGGKEIAYSGDTEWTDALPEVARGTDLFICECYSFDKKINYHMNYRALRDQREKLGCRRLILMHMSDDMLGHLGGIEADWAEDGKKIIL